jgi:hypothetical protein
MALDFTLIEKATNYSIDQFNKRTLTDCPYIFILNEFLDPELLEKLYKFALTNNEWIMQKDYTKIEMYRNNRFKLNWESDTVVEETHIVLENLTEVFNQFYNKNNKFLGINLWKDITGFSLAKHIDNPDIDLSMQIYLNSSADDLGTKFTYQNITINTPYIKNHGYIMDNLGKVAHYFDAEIPLDYSRYSLYAIWTKIQ